MLRSRTKRRLFVAPTEVRPLGEGLGLPLPLSEALPVALAVAQWVASTAEGNARAVEEVLLSAQHAMLFSVPFAEAIVDPMSARLAAEAHARMHLGDHQLHDIQVASPVIYGEPLVAAGLWPDSATGAPSQAVAAELAQRRQPYALAVFNTHMHYHKRFSGWLVVLEPGMAVCVYAESGVIAAVLSLQLPSVASSSVCAYVHECLAPYAHYAESARVLHDGFAGVTEGECRRWQWQRIAYPAFSVAREGVGL